MRHLTYFADFEIWYLLKELQEFFDTWWWHELFVVLEVADYLQHEIKTPDPAHSHVEAHREHQRNKHWKKDKETNQESKIGATIWIIAWT